MRKSIQFNSYMGMGSASGPLVRWSSAISPHRLFFTFPLKFVSVCPVPGFSGGSWLSCWQRLGSLTSQGWGYSPVSVGHVFPGHLHCNLHLQQMLLTPYICVPYSVQQKTILYNNTPTGKYLGFLQLHVSSTKGRFCTSLSI